MTTADITGDNSVHAIVLPAPARWVLFTLIGTGTARIGGSSTSSTVGEPLVASAAGAVLLIPRLGEFARYQTKEFYAYVPTGAPLSISAKE